MGECGYLFRAPGAATKFVVFQPTRAGLPRLRHAFHGPIPNLSEPSPFRLYPQRPRSIAQPYEQGLDMYAGEWDVVGSGDRDRVRDVLCGEPKS